MSLAAAELSEGLTAAQREAVSHVDGPLLVLAGPGSGKTTVVTRRVANLVGRGIPPWQILALTFTNKAAGEMRERIMHTLPEDLPGVRGLTVATFHSFCARLLRRYAAEARLNENYAIYDTADQREAIKQALKTAGMDSKNWTPAGVASAISAAKNQLLDASGYAQNAGDFYTRSIARLFREYESILKANNALDFDDLLVVAARLLRDSEPVRRELQERFRYILIDEYQDTNHAQFVIAHTLASAHGNICVVGDPDQSIYAWRGADIRNILEFETHYPNAEVIALGQNFRSTGHIVKTADTLIRRNSQRKHKDLHTQLGEGEKPLAVACRDEHDEARMIVDEMKRRAEEESIAWKDMAVLYRVNALSRVLEEAFRDAQLPYVIARGTAFYDRKEIKDALAYLRLTANPADEVSLRRIINTPTRGIGRTTLEKIEIFAIRNQIGFFDGLRRVGEVGGLTARAVRAVQNFTAMIDGWRRFADAQREHDGAGLLPAEETGDRSPLADLVDRIVREAGLEAMYKEAKVEEERERYENLEELINAAADFHMTDADGDSDEGTEARRHEGRDKSTSPAPAPGSRLRGRRQHVNPAVLRGPSWPSVVNTRNVSREPLPALSAFLESIALVSDADAIDPDSGAVTLMTLHAAKGLEFDVVAIAGLEQGLLPHSRAVESSNPADIEEERRLCFVGITRARRHLLLSRAAVRTHRGYRERTVPSQFLSELPEESVIFHDRAGADLSVDEPVEASGERGWSGRRRAAGGRRGADAAADAEGGSWSPRSASADDEPAPFPVGCMVRHPSFGLGRVEGITRRPGGSSSARVNFAGLGVKTLILKHAGLQRIE